MEIADRHGWCPRTCVIRGEQLGDIRMVAATGQRSAGGLEWSASALFERVFWMGDFNYRVEGAFEEIQVLVTRDL